MMCVRFAFFTLARDSAFVALVAGTLMVGFSFVPPLAFAIGATVALIFSIGLLTRGYFLTEERFIRSEPWLALRPDERPPDEWGRGLAQAQLKMPALRQRCLGGCQYSLRDRPLTLDRGRVSEPLTPS